jgi:hypothetical protein
MQLESASNPHFSTAIIPTEVTVESFGRIRIQNQCVNGLTSSRGAVPGFVYQ